jgi:hypothetical protein
VTDGLRGISILTDPGGYVAALKQCELHDFVPKINVYCQF